MVQVTPFLLVLSLALVAPAFSAGKCELTGCWINDQGSIIRIYPLEADNSFYGYYFPAVENTPGSNNDSPLVGFQHEGGPWKQPTFGFTVKWSASDMGPNSISVFTGQCLVENGGEETLKTTWILQSDADNCKDDWKTIKIGTDTFTRYEWQQGGIARDCKAHRRTCDADRKCSRNTCRNTCF